MKRRYLIPSVLAVLSLCGLTSSAVLLGNGLLALFGFQRKCRTVRRPLLHHHALAALVTAVICAGWALPSEAIFIDHVGVQDASSFQSIWGWDFTSAAPNTSVIAGPNWHREVQSGAGAGVQNLTMKVRHLAPPPDPGDNPQSPTPPGFYTLSIPNLTRPTDPLVSNTEKVVALQSTHPGLGHFDVVSLAATVGKEGNAAVVGTGKHSGAALSLWSYTPIFKGRIQVEASYNTGANRVVEPGRSVVEGFRESGTLTPPGETRRPTDYVVRFTGSPTTELTLAFLGEVDGVPGKLDLMAGIDLFGGAAGILAPLFDDAGAIPGELFAAVDLVEWLTFAPSVTPEPILSISDGRSALLPGYLFATGPITFDAASGFLTSTPFTGDVRLVGMVDGTLVPEPSSLTLLAGGLLVCLLWSYRRNARGHGVTAGGR
jgi:hypothetical protein